ncbi:MAG: AlpA family phage regulatory protein [Hylemonella sp.]|nr:AlpA family phage regulatory protein [Hylemonella sp.]
MTQSTPNKSTDAATVQPHEKLLRLPAVCEQTCLGKSSVYSIEDFPKPVVLSRRAVAWKQSEISAWIESRTTRSGAK